MAALFDYEEDQKDHEIKEKEAAQLELKNMQDEKAIRDKVAGESDVAVIRCLIRPGQSESKPGGDTQS